MVWRIDVNDEWTHDAELAESAIEAGYGAVEYDEDGLVEIINRLEVRISDHQQLFQELYRTIHERVVDGANSNVHTKNAFFSLIEHDLKEFERRVNSI